MKRMLLSIAFVVGTCVFLNAARDNPLVANAEIAGCVNQDGDFTEVKLESLNEDVQKAIGAYTETYTIKAIGYNEEKKQAKVVLVSKADESEKIVILNEEGKIVE